MTENEVDYFHFEKDKKNFEDLGKENGFRYWFARDLMRLLGYTHYTAFKKAINKAITVCSTINIDILENFLQVKREIDQIAQEDYRLSKFACYLVAMNGDPKKKEVAKAQAYFITATECFKRYINEAQQIERIVVRGEISEQEKSLHAVAKNSGIQNYAFFQNRGYVGLYNMHLKKLREHKGIPDGRTPLDFMGKEELAANLFRITQTQAKIRNEELKGQKTLEDAAYTVGREVRQTMEKISGTKPENLPIDEDINRVKSTVRSAQKEFIRIGKSKS